MVSSPLFVGRVERIRGIKNTGMFTKMSSRRALDGVADQTLAGARGAQIGRRRSVRLPPAARMAPTTAPPTLLMAA